MALGGKVMVHRAPVSGGPCAGAKFITALESWDGIVGKLDEHKGHYSWNAYRRMWVWKSLNVRREKPKDSFINSRVTSGQFTQNIKRPKAADFS